MNADTSSHGITMIEFFSGIGGMRCAIHDALERNNEKIMNDECCEVNDDEYSSNRLNAHWFLQSCTAYEISLYANQFYSLNFHEPISCFRDDRRNTDGPKKKHKQKSFSIYTKLIEQLEPEDVHGVDLWTMSPPCQPFTSTRNAKQLDSLDERCKGFKAILALLKMIDDENKRPKWIFLENVKGFYGSDMLDQWYECLRDCGYTFEEYLLNPTQLGVPNNRSRYYMVAERSNRFGTLKNSYCTSLPQAFSPGAVKPLSEYIITKINKEDLKRYTIPDSVFETEWAKDLPVVSALDTITHCFTAAYGRQIHRATGSLLLMDTSDRTQSVAENPINRSDMTIYKGKLRRFTEYELLHLFGFPRHFQFPENLSLDHRYKLIGNSVNVKVVSFLLQYLLLESKSSFSGTEKVVSE